MIEWVMTDFEAGSVKDAGKVLLLVALLLSDAPRERVGAVWLELNVVEWALETVPVNRLEL